MTRRIERPILVNAETLTYGVAPGGVIEAVIDNGVFVHELGATPIPGADQLFGRVTLERRPFGEVTFLVNRGDRAPPLGAPTAILTMPGTLTKEQAEVVRALLVALGPALSTHADQIVALLERIDRSLRCIIDRQMAA